MTKTQKKNVNTTCLTEGPQGFNQRGYEKVKTKSEKQNSKSTKEKQNEIQNSDYSNESY